jgi:cytochrome P450
VIRAGDAIVASIASANRDERVFADPYRFDPTRTPNPHIAFGGGVHYCVGQAVARLTIQIVIDEFLSKLDRFELAQPPVHLVSNLAAGMVRAPMRLTMRNGAGPAGPPDGGPGAVPQRGLTHIGLV